MTSNENSDHNALIIKHRLICLLDKNDVDVLFFSKPEPGFDTVSLPGVHDHVYPPQKKAFKMLGSAQKSSFHAFSRQIAAADPIKKRISTTN